jgi:hypothetical protein
MLVGWVAKAAHRMQHMCQNMLKLHMQSNLTDLLQGCLSYSKQSTVTSRPYLECPQALEVPAGVAAAAAADRHKRKNSCLGLPGLLLSMTKAG